MIISLASCTEETITNNKIALPHSKVIQEEVEVPSNNASIKNESNNRYTQDHLDIHNMIQNELYEEARTSLEKEIYGEKSLHKEIYTSRNYTGYLGLYATLLKKINDLSKNQINITPNTRKYRKELREELSISLEKFYNHFLKDCLIKESQNCELLQTSLSKEVSISNIIIMIASREKNTIEKIKLLGAIFDISRNKNIKKLENYYLEVVLSLLNSFNKGYYKNNIDHEIDHEIDREIDREIDHGKNHENSSITDESKNITNKMIRKHLTNILRIIKTLNWSQIDHIKIKYFETIKPWKYNAKKEDPIFGSLRKELIPFIPIYAKNNKNIKNELLYYVESEIQDIKINKKDLNQYPAYEGITLDLILGYPIEISYLTLGVYFQKIGITDSQKYLEFIDNKNLFMDNSFKIFKLLVRWDLAQLSIYSTEKLHWKFSQQSTKTQPFLQETLDWSKNLIPIWNKFHTERAFFSKSFLETNAKYSHDFDEIDVQHFFTSINRNILKTTVYPNMMAFAFYMAKTEWSATIRVLWFRISLNTNLIMNYMMAGRYSDPWFNFTNLKEKQMFWGIENKKSLFRSEIYDSLYYFLTSKVFETYQINPDDFLSLIGESILKKRRTSFEETLSIQRKLYMTGNTKINQLIKWCQGIKKSHLEHLNHFGKEKEFIHFYSLSENTTPLTPSQYTFSNIEKIFSHGLSDMAASTLHDKYRLELSPILYTLNQYVAITYRVRHSYPQLGINPLNQTKRHLKSFDFLKMKYLGMQKMISKKIDNCEFIGEKEAKRRSMDLAFAHSDYFSKIVYPLMANVKSGEISLSQANSVLQDFHDLSEGMLDKIVISSSKEPVFFASHLTYMLRTRKFLISGQQFNSQYTSPLSIPPIVGNHLEIPIPSDFMNDNSNPYIYTNNYTQDTLKFIFEEDSSKFAKSISNVTTGALRESILSVGKFTNWDRYDTQNYIKDMKHRLQYEVTLLQIPEQRYINVEKPECLDHEAYKNDQIQDDHYCIIRENPDLMNIVEVMKNLLGAYAINNKQRKYLKLINGNGWVGNIGLHTIIKYDPNTPYDYEIDSWPFQKVAGIFDIVYKMIDSNYLGSSFQTDWDEGINRNAGGGIGGKGRLQLRRAKKWLLLEK